MAIKYNVTERAIKDANGLVSDQIYHLSELFIPAPPDVKECTDFVISYANQLKAEKKRRNDALR